VKDCFPRTAKVPAQSPLFWASHKDRYLRQLLIGDIQEATKRELLVYFTDVDNTDSQIDAGDDQFLFELLKARKSNPVDLLIETAGGFTDATEKICSMLRQLAPDLRVIVPRKAKSNGTVIALTGSTIVMSATSELGPIDPAISGVPVEFILKQQDPNPIQYQAALHYSTQTKSLASSLLKTGMLKGKPDAEIEALVEKLATKANYPSHGATIDLKEAQRLGLNVTQIETTDSLWDQIWLLRTMYAYDCPLSGYAKLFESATISSAVSIKRPAPISP
jgi:hypothetical protein